MEKITLSSDDIKPEIFDCLIDISEGLRKKADRFAAMKVKGENKRFAAVRPVKDNDEVNFRVAAADKGAVDVYIYDVIGFPFIEAQDLLYQIPSDAKTVNVHLNTPGGDIFEGVAIYNQLLAHSGEVNVFVDSLAASAGSLIAMAGKNITMKPASFIMIHNGWSRIAGDSTDLRAEADLLDKINVQFADIYAKRTGKTRAEMLAFMDKETWFTADEAVEIGMASNKWDGKDDKSAPQALFDLSVFANTPDEVLRAASIKPIDNGKHNNKTEDVKMDPKLKALLVRLGLAKDASDEVALKFLADIDVEKIALAEDRQAVEAALDKLTQDNDPTDKKQASYTDADIDAKVSERMAAEDARRSEIRQDCKKAGLDDGVAEELINKKLSADAARKEIFARMQTVHKPIGPGGIHIMADEHDKFRAAAIDGIGVRFGHRPEKPAPGHEQFQAASITYIARVCMERAGIDTRQFVSRKQVADAIMRFSRQMSAAGTFTTDDFSSIFLDVANKSLQKAYKEYPATWRPIVNVVPASDFKTIYGVSLSEAPDLELIGENGEYKGGSMSDNQESYSCFSYGKMIYLTRVMIINDDLRAFTRLPQLLGNAGARKQSDLVWAKITGNPTMNDGVALFHADHSNIETVSANIGVLDTDNLSSMRVGMRTQTGMNGAKLDLRPKFVAIPVAQETNTDIILLSSALPEDDKSSGVHNPWRGKLTPIAEPRLDDNSTKAWYGIADPSQIDTIEVAFLDGVETPYVEQQPLFERDAIGSKVRIDFGCGIMDHRGFWYNPGEEDS